jgi:hypothetical protein
MFVVADNDRMKGMVFIERIAAARQRLDYVHHRFCQSVEAAIVLINSPFSVFRVEAGTLTQFEEVARNVSATSCG